MNKSSVIKIHLKCIIPIYTDSFSALDTTVTKSSGLDISSVVVHGFVLLLCLRLIMLSS